MRIHCSPPFKSTKTSNPWTSFWQVRLVFRPCCLASLNLVEISEKETLQMHVRIQPG